MLVDDMPGLAGPRFDILVALKEGIVVLLLISLCLQCTTSNITEQSLNGFLNFTVK